jgi:hypothetical protein
MATTIADLLIKLSVQTSELTTGLKSAEASITDFVSGVKKVVGGLTLGLAAKKLADEMMGVISAAAELSKVGQKVGMSATDISRLASAADDAGLPVETLARGLRFLSRSMTEAQDGSLELQFMFKEMGVNLEEGPNEAILQMADAFGKMNDEERKTAVSMKAFGRGGAELVSFLSEGRETIEEWIASNERMGAVMGAGLASQSRVFRRTLKEIGDAIDGLKIALAEALLPYLQQAADDMVVVAQKVNRLRAIMAPLVVVMRDVAIAISAMAFVKMVVIIESAIAAVGGLAGAFAFLVNPIFLAAVALAAFAIAWQHVQDASVAAQKELEKYDRTIKRMSIKDLDAELAKLGNAVEDLTEDLAKLRAEQDAAITATAGEDAAAIVALNRMIAAKEAELKIAEEKVRKATTKKEVLEAKVSLKVVTDPEAFKALTGKLDELKAAAIAFQDPLRGQVRAFEAWVAALKLGKKFSEELIELEKKVRAQFLMNLKATNDLQVAQARRTGALKEEVAYYDVYLAELQIAYDTGIVDLEGYFFQRETVIKDRSAAEIAALQESLKDPGLTEAKKIEIEAEIRLKKTTLASDLVKEGAAAKKALEDAAKSTREGIYQSLVDKNTEELEVLKNQLEDGITSIRDYYKKVREVIEEEAKKQITNIEAAQAITPTGTKEWQDLENEKKRISARAGLDRIKAYRDETNAYRDNYNKMWDTTQQFLALKAEAVDGEISRLEASNAAELEAIKRKHADERLALTKIAGDTIVIKGETVTKTIALEQQAALQEDALRQKTKEQEIEVWEKKLQLAGQVAGGMSQLFTDLYELSGKKIKAFFYMQKAAAVAEAIINTATGVTAALKLGPVIGPVMAAIITAMGAVQIAKIMSSTIKGAKKGGAINEGSGREDDVLIRVMRGEYIQPKDVVSYYGVNVMEAIRRKLIPKDAFRGVPFFPVMSPGLAYATGGAVSGAGLQQVANTVTVPVNVYGGDRNLASRLRENIEEVVIKTLREQIR